MNPARPSRTLSLIAAILLAAPLALAQTAAPTAPAASQSSAAPLAFDVVSIKPNHSGSPAMVDRTPPDGYSVENFLIRAIISQAFDVRYDLITGGPGWLDSDHYDFTAKVAGDDLAAYKALTKDQRDRMLQAVLTERFHLVAHTVVKQLPGYTLTIAKGGPKLTETPTGKVLTTVDGPTCLHTRDRAGLMAVVGCTVGALADSLGYPSGRTVIDKTGLTGRYSFDLHWTPDNTPADSPLTGGPSIFTAVQEQLGLKLSPSTAPLDVLIIDSAQPPTPN